MSNPNRAGKLKLKGNKQLFKLKSNKKKLGASSKQIDEDREERGGWRRIENELDLKGGTDVALECGDFSRCYLAALDTGKFTLGTKHFKFGEAPSPEEILSLIHSPDDPKVSFKTGFGKFVGVSADGALVATADAVGARERFDIVFQDGKSAIQSVSSGLFLSLEPNDDGHVYVCSKTAQANEMINAGDCETTYIKKFQHSRVDLKDRMISYNVDDKQAVKMAQKEGNLHETLLNRRAKLKSDKYC
uniref:Protein FRG1 n=1 Tax=Globodera pallida TaxID=36090 RepID=A0A183BYY7_GLOPA